MNGRGMGGLEVVGMSGWVKSVGRGVNSQGRRVKSTGGRAARGRCHGESSAGAREGMDLVARTNFCRDMGEDGWQGRRE